MAKDGLELLILPDSISLSWNFRHELPFLIYPRALCTLGKHSVAVLAPSSGLKEDLHVIFIFPDLPSPKLNSSMNVVSMGQNVSLSCSSKNTSVNVTYSLFLGRKHLQTKKSEQTVTFYLKISNANETGPYKCKTNDSSGPKYSQDFNFTIASKCLSPYNGGLGGGGGRGGGRQKGLSLVL